MYRIGRIVFLCFCGVCVLAIFTPIPAFPRRGGRGVDAVLAPIVVFCGWEREGSVEAEFA